jgi:hypothetical protein
MNNWENEEGIEVQPSMGEIFVAQGKRRRSVALGKKERLKIVRAKGMFKA